MDAKSRDRLITRFESFRDNEPIGLLYSEWQCGIEPLDPKQLPEPYESFEQQIAFSFSPSDHLESLLIIKGDDSNLKRLVMSVCSSAAIHFKNDLLSHGFEINTRTMSVPWLWSLVEAARRQCLGAEGLVGGTTYCQSKHDKNLTVDEQEVLDESLGWSMADFVPRRFMQLENIVESSINLISYLGEKPESPKKSQLKQKTADQLLQDLYEAAPRFCCEESLKTIAEKLGLKSTGSISATCFYKDVLKGKRDYCKSAIEQRRQAEKRIRAGMPYVDDKETIDAVDKSLGEYFERIADEVHRVDEGL